MKRETILSIITALLALLFTYAGLIKLLHYEKSKQEMLNQVLPKVMALQLVWMIPAVELVITFFLLIKTTRLQGLVAAFLLLSSFTIYIAISMSGTFGRIPCSCGGILKNMGYWTHLGFNLIFIAIAILGIAFEKQWKPINRWLHFLKRKEASQN